MQKKADHSATEREQNKRAVKYIEKINTTLKILLDNIADLYVDPNARKRGDEIR